MLFSVGVDPRSIHVVRRTDGGKIIQGWPVERLTDCDHPVIRRDVCHKVPCVQACGRDCHVHQHCEACGAIRCHGYWWRFKPVRVVEVSLVDRPAVHDPGKGWLATFPFHGAHGHMSTLPEAGGPSGR